MRSLYKRLSLIFAISLFIIFTIIVYGINFSINSIIVDEKKEVLIEKAGAFEEIYADAYESGILDVTRLRSEINALENYLDADVLLVDKNQNIIASKKNASLVINNSDLKVYEFNRIFQGEIIQKQAYVPSLNKDEVLVVGYPIKVNDQVEYALFLNQSIPEIKAAVASVNSIIFIAMIISAMITFALLYLVTNTIVAEIKVLNIAAKYMASGNFEKRILSRRNDELGELADSMNNMASELYKIDETKRCFISNLSHDLRSPMQTITGYTRAIIDGTIPAEKRDKYLKIVLSESERLTKLTNDILDLSKMEGGKLPLLIGEIDVKELILNELDKFEQKIEDKNLNVMLRLPEKNLIALGDQSQYTRVIQNLIDNAVKFAEESGDLEVKIIEKKPKIFVSVRNSGPYIVKEELDEVWRRFSKLDSSRGKVKSSSGLGLAIVKEIIKAHDEEVFVYSSEDIGVEFSFTMTKKK